MIAKFRYFTLLISLLCSTGLAKEQIVQTNVNLKKSSQKQQTKISEDNIPVIEIKGEGKPMTAAQIRALEEEAEGKPLDIKVRNTWTPKECPNKAKRLDFVTFHYKGFYEDGKKFDQTHGKEPVTIQLGVGMALPGLDKGLRGVCDNELRKITIPWRLARKRKSKVWKNVPKEEHWITFDVEIFQVQLWAPKVQFEYFDLDGDKILTVSELTKFTEKMQKEYGKVWPSEDIDKVIAAKYFMRYFDENQDQKIDLREYESRMIKDQVLMKEKSNKRKTVLKQSRKRDPGMAWVLDFNNDGLITIDELDAAPDLFTMEPEAATKWSEQRQNISKTVKTEL